jgi:hypothetical protein
MTVYGGRRVYVAALMGQPSEQQGIFQGYIIVQPCSGMVTFACQVKKVLD